MIMITPSKNNSRPSRKSSVNKRTVWFIKNTSTEGPGYLIVLLKRWKISFRICDLERGDELPVLQKGDAVIVLGGPMSANDKSPSMRMLLKWIKGLLKNKTPYLGICLGLQTLVKAAGGRVIKSPVKEVGLKRNQREYFVCQLNELGKSDALFYRFAESFSIFQLHGETVMLRKGMNLLAEGKGCLNQIVKVSPNSYGIQGHLEMTTSLLSEWLKTDPDLKKKNSKQMLDNWNDVKTELHLNCKKILLNFLKIAEILS